MQFLTLDRQLDRRHSGGYGGGGGVLLEEKYLEVEEDMEVEDRIFFKISE